MLTKTLKRELCKYDLNEVDANGKRKLLATIPAGTVVAIEFPNSDLKNYFGEIRKDATKMILSANGISVRCKSINWNNYFKVKSNPPSPTTMMRWEMDGYCMSLGGHKTEPDGWSYDGTPSWLMAMGLI